MLLQEIKDLNANNTVEVKSYDEFRSLIKKFYPNATFEDTGDANAVSQKMKTAYNGIDAVGHFYFEDTINDKDEPGGKWWRPAMGEVIKPKVKIERGILGTMKK